MKLKNWKINIECSGWRWQTLPSIPSSISRWTPSKNENIMNDDMLEIMSFSQNQIVGRIPWFLFFDGARWRTNLMSLYFAEFQPYDIFFLWYLRSRKSETWFNPLNVINCCLLNCHIEIATNLIIICFFSGFGFTWRESCTAWSSSCLGQPGW